MLSEILVNARFVGDAPGPRPDVRPVGRRQPRLFCGQHTRLAASAAAARPIMVLKKALLCPTKRPVAVKNWTAAVALTIGKLVGRITEHSGRPVLMNLHGLGMTWLFGNCVFALRSGKTRPSPLFTAGASPALSFQISKWATSVPPMLVTIRSTSNSEV